MIPHPRLRLQPLEDRITPALSFAAPLTFPVGTLPLVVGTGDFDGDGRPDVVTANGNLTISVLRNTTPTRGAAPSFAAPQTFAADVGNDPNTIQSADFNLDGRPDIVVAGQYSVMVFLNTTPVGTTALTFRPSAEFSSNGKVFVADFNADGRPDLAAASGYSSATVLTNVTPQGATAAAFVEQRFGTLPGIGEATAVLDANGDQRPDVVVGNASDGYYTLINTTPAGAALPTFGQDPRPANGSLFYPGAVGDFNGDGRPDVASIGSGGLAALTNGTSAFAYSATANPGFQQHLIAGDFDGDGRTDLAGVGSLSGGQWAAVRLNTTPTGAAAPTFSQTYNYFGNGPLDVAAADFNGDGRLDLAVASYYGNGVEVLTNTTPDVSVTPSVVVGQLGDTGVWAYNRATTAWTQLSPRNATALAAAPNGNVAAVFDTGVWYYRPGDGWTRINGHVATAVAMDALGNVAASFPGFGVGLYIPYAHGWALRSRAEATNLAMGGNGDLVGSFGPGLGLLRYTVPTGWQQLTAIPADSLAVGRDGAIVASFNGMSGAYYGTYQYRTATWWQLIENTQSYSPLSSAVSIDGSGRAVGAFTAPGGPQVWRYTTSESRWRYLMVSGVTLIAADWTGNVVYAGTSTNFGEVSPAYGAMQFGTGPLARLLAVGG